MQQVLMTGTFRSVSYHPPALKHYHVTNSDDRRGDLPGHIADLALCATDLHLVCRWTWHSSWKIDLDLCCIIYPCGAQTTNYGTVQLFDLGQVTLKLSPQGWKSERPPGSPVLGIFCVEVVRSF